MTVTVTSMRQPQACPVCGQKVERWELAHGVAITMNGGWPTGGTMIGAGSFPLPPGYIDKTEPVPALNEWTFEPCGHQVVGPEVELRDYVGPEPCWNKYNASTCVLPLGHDGWHEAEGCRWTTR